MQHRPPREILEAAFGYPKHEPSRHDFARSPYEGEGWREIRPRPPLPELPAERAEALDFPLLDVNDEDDDDEVLGALHGIANDAELGPIVEEEGTEALAWYCPYAFYGPDAWGIWWNEPAMLRAAARLTLRARREHAAVRFAMAGHCLRRTVRQHELFHFTVEYTAAHLSLQRHGDCYRPSFSSSTRREREEVLATAWEMAWLSKRAASEALPAAALKAIRAAWRETPRPPPYSEWENATGPQWQGVAEQHADALCGMPAAGRLYGDLIRLAPRTPAPDVVPEYSVGVPLILKRGYASALGRLAPPTVRQVLRHARAAEFSGRPPGVHFEQRSKHDAAVVRAGKPRPVTLDKTKWDRVDWPIVGQLADLFDLSRQAYLQEIYAL